MVYVFTPAAQRALAEAASWHGSSDSPLWGLPEVLMALLAEPECRAAVMLRARGITRETVRDHWSGLNRDPGGSKADLDQVSDRAQILAPAMRQGLRAVEQILFDFPRPLAVATEHLLLGIAAAQQPASDWLAQRGLTPEHLAGEIRRLYGLPLAGDAPIDLEPEPTQATAATMPSPRADAVETPGTDVRVLRVLDASANRAREAIRVVEDYARFVLDDPLASRQLKELRHALSTVLAQLPRQRLYAARDTEQDVGTGITTVSEALRADSAEVANANFKRFQEALRSLEEFGKLLTPADHVNTSATVFGPNFAGFGPTLARRCPSPAVHLAAQGSMESASLGEAFKQLRYRAYTVERTLSLATESRRRLEDAQLYVLLDGRGDAAEFERLATVLVEAGVHFVQLRDKRLADRELLERARLLRQLTAGSRTRFIMNDRPDLGVLARADGVHVGQEELPVAEVRLVLGTRGMVGVSTHSIEQARAAVAAGANYIGVGPTFASATKKFAAFTGVSLLRQVAAEIRLPAFAIGGITLDNLEQVLEAGFTRVAVSGAIVNADDPGAAAREFLQRLPAVPVFH